MNALVIAPATMRLNSDSGMTFAAQNASRSFDRPKYAPMTERRSQPRKRLATNVVIMIAVAPTTPCRITASPRRLGYRAGHGSEETQAHGAQAHPSERSPRREAAVGEERATHDREASTASARRGRGGAVEHRPSGGERHHP